MSETTREQRDRRIFERAHSHAAGATARAQNTASYHQAEAAKYKASQAASDANTQRNGKTVYCEYLSGLHTNLKDACRSHQNAIIKGDYYVDQWKGNPTYRQHWTNIKNITSELRKAEKGIDAHAKAIQRERRACRCR